MVSQFAFHYYFILGVWTLDELVDTEEVDHKLKRLSIPQKVLLDCNKRHFLSELEPDKYQSEKDAGQNQESERGYRQCSVWQDMNGNCDIEPKSDALVHHCCVEYRTIKYYAVLIPPDDNEAL